jgi:hypothetical protein
MGRRWTLAVIAGLLGASCFEPVREVGVVGRGGGTVEGRGVRLVVPPGAVSQDTTFTIEPIDAVPPDGFDAVGAAVVLSPEGLRFDAPVRLELPVFAEPADLRVATTPRALRDFDVLPAALAQHRAVVSVQHFSIFIPVTPKDGGTVDAGIEDAGIEDAGVEDAGEPPDAGPEPDVDAGAIAPLEPCQVLDGGGLAWTLIPLPGPIGSPNAANTLVIERPGRGYVFSVGRHAISVDRDLAILDSYDTMLDTPQGGFSGIQGGAFGREVVLNSVLPGQFPLSDYGEWRVGPDGRFVVLNGSHVTRRESGSSYAGVIGTEGTGSGYAPRRGGFLVASSGWGARSVAFVPSMLTRPVQWAPMPLPWNESAGGVELADGTALFPLNDTGSRVLGIFSLGADGGLQPTPYRYPYSGQEAQIVAAGGPDGFLIIRPEPTSMTIFRPDGGSAKTVALPQTAGARFPLYDPVRTLMDGGIIALAIVTPDDLGSFLPTPLDLFVVRYPPGDALLIASGLRPTGPPGAGAVRADSFVVAWDDAAGLHVARVCLPP